MLVPQTVEFYNLRRNFIEKKKKKNLTVITSQIANCQRNNKECIYILYYYSTIKIMQKTPITKKNKEKYYAEENNKDKD